ncbi:MAG: ATP-binding cassette domain-containing protein [Deltaproteobacteria bacterium]|jgi:ATP-binding cassette subfamily F protein 3|nr:ATP-binding cassette domain-containing protein [Deltaproteobacteria bacterium]
MISIDNIHKSYGGHVLFDGVSFTLNPREKVGLVGRNGNGKTTLLRILVGEEDVDSGTITIPRHYRIGHVRQHLRFSEPTVLAEGIASLPENEADQHWKAERILAGLGFGLRDLQQPPEIFSGGYQVRLNLAKVLISEPDLLLLDEPTNYLDIAAIRWVVKFLQAWPRELLLITHDRSFMDQAVTHVVGLHRCKARKIAGDTGKYYDQIAQDEEIYEKTRLNDERRRKEVELFISRFRAKARLANLVQSRIKTLDKMEKKEKLDTLRDLEFSFREAPFKGRHLMTVDDLAFGYDENAPLFEGLCFTVNHHDRIAVIGRNGQGKTTLLKALSGELQTTRGHIHCNPNVQMGFFDQTHINRLVGDRTVEEEILWAGEDLDRQTARNICGAMMFSGNDALKPVKILSGGEKSRVLLGQLLARKLNLLLLDEPSNHLDMESCDALLAAIDAFDGAVIMVTHNEMFLHAIARRLIVFQNRQATLFEGSYQRFLDRLGWHDESDITRPERAPAETPSAPRLSKKEARRERSEIITLRNQAIKPLEKKIARAEKRIEAGDATLQDLHAAMQEATAAGDGTRIAELGKSIHACEQEIEKQFGFLEELTDQLALQARPFDKQLKQLDEKQRSG